MTENPTPTPQPRQLKVQRGTVVTVRAAPPAPAQTGPVVINTGVSVVVNGPAGQWGYGIQDVTHVERDGVMVEVKPASALNEY